MKVKSSTAFAAGVALFALLMLLSTRGVGPSQSQSRQPKKIVHDKS